MAPSAIDPPALPVRQEKTYPPARIYPVKETKFEKPIPAQPDGREEALAKPAGSVAIVIDKPMLHQQPVENMSILFPGIHPLSPFVFLFIHRENIFLSSVMQNSG